MDRPNSRHERSPPDFYELTDRSIPSSTNEHSRNPSSTKDQSTRPLNDTPEDSSSKHLSEEEERILSRELDSPIIAVPYHMLFRYASKVDMLIFATSAACAAASGVVMPLMTVDTTPFYSVNSNMLTGPGDIRPIRRLIPDIFLRFSQ